MGNREIKCDSSPVPEAFSANAALKSNGASESAAAVRDPFESVIQSASVAFT